MPDNQKTILVVDDEASVRKLLRRCFESESYCVLEASNRQQALESISANSIDLVTLDINLDGDDGLSLAREIRSHSAVPIIMVSGKGELIDKVVGLEVGADDYISKPFELREVLARVKSALRRTQLNETATTRPAQNTVIASVQPESKQLRFANCLLCPNTRDLTTADGTVCVLTTAEFNLLYTLASHAHQVLSRDQIMDEMKGSDWNPSDRTIDNQIARLRKKLAGIGISQSIKTVRGIGYQFTNAVDLYNEAKSDSVAQSKGA